MREPGECCRFCATPQAGRGPKYGMETATLSRWQKAIAILKPASVRGLIVRLIIAGLGAVGVGASIDPATASTALAVILALAEASL